MLTIHYDIFSLLISSYTIKLFCKIKLIWSFYSESSLTRVFQQRDDKNTQKVWSLIALFTFSSWNFLFPKTVSSFRKLKQWWEHLRMKHKLLRTLKMLWMQKIPKCASYIVTDNSYTNSPVKNITDVFSLYSLTCLS